MNRATRPGEYPVSSERASAPDRSAGRGAGCAPDPAARADGPLLAVTVLIVAKAPVSGLAKTRLTPPLSPAQAARWAAAALLDTMDAVLATPVASRVLAYTGDLAAAERGAEISGKFADFVVHRQRGHGFGARLANAHADAARAGLPVLQIGMDTPQVTPDLLAASARSLLSGADAVLGPATDGGWWGLGLPDPRCARILADVPMSTPHTGAHTRTALRDCGYRVRLLPTLTDVDRYPDALGIVDHCTGRFADEVHAVAPGPVLR